MKKYLKYLINDIREAVIKPLNITLNQQDLNDMCIEELERKWEELSDPNKYDYEPRREMGDIFGLKKDAFPPSFLLKEKQLISLVKEIESLWESYKFYPDYPYNMPEKRKYELLVNQLEGNQVKCLGERDVNIEFCHDNEPENCPFGFEYCRCKYVIELLKKWDNSPAD